MTEKQRWLLRDLERWFEEEARKIGHYAPSTTTLKIPVRVKAARRVQAQALKVIAKWDKDKTKPWRDARAKLESKRSEVKRIILFEKTETALKAIKKLGEPV